MSEKALKMEPLSQKNRIFVFFINSFLAWALFFASTSAVSPFGTDQGVWFLGIVAYWLLVLVTNPFFNPPKDNLASSISVFLVLIPLNISSSSADPIVLQTLYWSNILIAFLVAVSALISIINQGGNAVVNNVGYQISNKLGKPEILFTPVVLISAIGFYEINYWPTLIMAFWTLMVVLKPVELTFRLGLFLRMILNGKIVLQSSVGRIQRVDDPNIIRISLSEQVNWKKDKVFVAHLADGKKRFLLPLFSQIQNEEVLGTGLLCSEVVQDFSLKTDVGNIYPYQDESTGLLRQLMTELNSDFELEEIAGIICEGSNIAEIKFQVTNEQHLEKGRIVCALIRQQKVYYQLLDAGTKEEHFQQNPFGMHIAHAVQIGCYSEENGFVKFPWLPEMNQPVFVVHQKESALTNSNEKDRFIIGRVPSTNFGITVVLSDLIEYHAAILGKTGTAKTELAFDTIREALKRETKVFCVDFTGEYRARLADCKPILIDIPEKDQKDMETLLFAVDAKGFKADAEQAQLSTLVRDKIIPEVKKKVEDFIEDKEKSLAVFELAEITNTRTTLRLTEFYLSAIMEWARKNRKKKRILIVLEEAHTIVPEAYSGSGFDANTKRVVDRIGQIALQGRKYGVGLLIVTQRTALVSKTVLSQCHTYFTHELIDKTSLDYLNGILSPGHVKAIPNLRFLELIAYGKAVKSEHPVLVKREFDQSKKDASDALNVSSIESSD